MVRNIIQPGCHKLKQNPKIRKIMTHTIVYGKSLIKVFFVFFFDLFVFFFSSATITSFAVILSQRQTFALSKKWHYTLKSFKIENGFDLSGSSLQLQVSLFRFLPHFAHRPLQSSLQSGLTGASTIKVASIIFPSGIL